METFSKALIICIFASASQANENIIVPFPVSRIKEVKFSGGVAGATSHYNNDWLPSEAFLPNQPVSQGWHSGPPQSPPPGLFPQLIWYDFKTEGVRPSEVAFQPCQEKQYAQRAPTSYQFVGSNDEVCNEDSTWTILCEDLSDREWRNHFEVRYCKAKPEVTAKFRCLGIRILNNRGDGWTSMRNIRMWERIEL